MSELDDSRFRSRLSGDAGVSALVGTRIYHKEAQQNPVRPYVVFERSSGGDQISGMEGYSGLENVNMDVDCYADTPTAAAQLCQAVIVAVRDSTANSFRGRVIGSPFPLDDNTPERVFRWHVEFSLWHSEG